MSLLVFSVLLALRVASVEQEPAAHLRLVVQVPVTGDIHDDLVDADRVWWSARPDASPVGGDVRGQVALGDPCP
ncbi:MAG: hypothetical protein V9E98_04815 [Candidatus Nanopelagicales bacterium]